ncbi:MAG: S-layer homology domain-containing protein, partial [Syntrophales bacterium]|nr:S-layer homology domain-containing protein [Syntrophales bacterium]
MKSTNLLRLLAALAAGVLMISCSSKMQLRLTQLDTPEHHTFAGVILLNQEKFADAGREFELALRLDPHNAKAHAGVGLVKAYHGDFTGGFDAIRQAEKYAKNNEEKIMALVGTIRVNNLSHATCLRFGTECTANDPWFKSSKEAFNQAVLINPNAASAHYFMGETYLTVLELELAGRTFNRVLDLNGDYVTEAAGRWRLTQKIQRAMPETMTGKKMALMERITRADMALLLMEEMKIDALYALRTPKNFSIRPKDLDKERIKAARPAGATDIARHPRKTDIEVILRIGMRGLDLYPDGTFRPDEPLDRASYAMIIEDLLIRVSGDQSLATRFVGSPSPFVDLQADLPYYNAVMVASSRGI